MHFHTILFLLFYQHLILLEVKIKSYSTSRNYTWTNALNNAFQNLISKPPFFQVVFYYNYKNAFVTLKKTKKSHRITLPEQDSKLFEDVWLPIKVSLLPRILLLTTSLCNRSHYAKNYHITKKSIHTTQHLWPNWSLYVLINQQSRKHTENLD